jgi:hypothetical protein
MSHRIHLTLTVLCIAAFELAASGADGSSTTRLLRTPTVSATQIAFAYANNIWMFHARAASRVASRVFKARRRTRIFRPMGNGWRSAPSMRATTMSA